MLLRLCGNTVAMVMTMKSYSELIKLPTFEERFDYLKLDGAVGEETFGSSRWLNQRLYKDPEWRQARDNIIVRDGCCDLAISDRDIEGIVQVHHINPITKEDILERKPCLFDPENLICTSDRTHKAIHYGDKSLLVLVPPERNKNDTCPWKR